MATYVLDINARLPSASAAEAAHPSSAEHRCPLSEGLAIRPVRTSVTTNRTGFLTNLNPADHEGVDVMTTMPSASYSITVRLEVPAGGASVSQLTTAVVSMRVVL